MGFRLTEEEAFQLGLRQDAKGNWHDPRKKPERRAASLANPDTGAGNGHSDGVGARLCNDSSSSLPVDQRNPPRRGEKIHSNEESSKGDREGSPGFRIVVTSYANRHQDPDNLYPKHFIDLIVGAGVLPDDGSKYVEGIEKKVTKVSSAKEERTVIEIFKRV